MRKKKRERQRERERQTEREKEREKETLQGRDRAEEVTENEEERAVRKKVCSVVYYTKHTHKNT